MYKYAVLFALVACAAAAPKPGFLAAPALHAAPLVAAAPVAAVAHSVPVGSSYSNTYKVSYKSPAVLAPAPLLAAAPALAYAAPATVISHGYAAPLTYAAQAPVVAIH